MDVRYSKLIQYKSALDAAYKKSSSVEIYNSDYDSTLQQAKYDGYKVLRNSKGEHKLIDIQEKGEQSTVEVFNEWFGGIFQ